PDGEPYARLRENDTSAGDRIKKAFGNACERAGIRDFTPHDCRHTWATWHYAKNRDLLALQRLGGWKTLSMVTRYTHVNVGELAHTIDNLPWRAEEIGGKLGDEVSKMNLSFCVKNGFHSNSRWKSGITKRPSRT